MTPNNLENRASTFPDACRKRNPNGCASTASIEFYYLQFGFSNRARLRFATSYVL